jgi:hypothetical protein
MVALTKTITITVTPITTETIIMIRVAALIAALAVSLPMLALPTLAQTIEACDWRASIQSLVEPWDAPENTRTFANGDVRLAVTDVIEPAAGAFHLVILSPPFDELGGRQCQIVSANGSVGFTGLTLDGMTSAYDPATGLTFTIEAGAYDPNTGGTLPRTLTVTLNQATGAITANVQGGK